MSADKEIMGRFAFDGAEDIAFHVYDAEISDDYDDPSCVTEVKFGELETLVEFLRYNFPGLFVATPPADDVREALAELIADSLAHPSFPRPAHVAPFDRDFRAADSIVARFEVRPRGPVTDAEVNAFIRAIDDGPRSYPTYRDSVRVGLEAARDA